MKKLNIGISPCPNDTYIFDAIYNQLIDVENFKFEFIFEDVETLNLMAKKNQLDIIKLSYANYFNVIDKYQMLTSGSALGFGVGPLLISKEFIPLEKIPTSKIAIPGINTTAHFLLQYAFPTCNKKTEYTFSDIENAVLNSEVEAGVIIHENRFTYAEKGLKKIIDLGAYWEEKTQLPIPLGGIAIQRDFSDEMKNSINKLVYKSILYSKEKTGFLSDFVKCHAQEMDEKVMQQHIDLYVNEETIQMSELGKKAVEKMASIAGIQTNLSYFI